jgi:hypothetical protein
MQRIGLLPMAASLAFAMASQAHAAADSLLQLGKGNGKTFTIYHLYSKPDGTTVVDEVPVTLVDQPSDKIGGQKFLFKGPLRDLTVRWSPDGMRFPSDAPTNHEKVPHMQLVLNGVFVVEVSNGRKVRVEPGNFLLQTDSDGFGHHMSCEAPKTGLGCIQVNIDPVDGDTFFAGMQSNGPRK